MAISRKRKSGITTSENRLKRLMTATRQPSPTPGSDPLKPLEVLKTELSEAQEVEALISILLCIIDKREVIPPKRSCGQANGKPISDARKRSEYEICQQEFGGACGTTGPADSCSGASNPWSRNDQMF